MYNFKLNQLQMGDILLYLSFFNEFCKSDVLIDFSKPDISYYRQDTDEYYNYIKSFIEFVNDNPRIIIDESSDKETLSIEQLMNFYRSNNKEFNLISRHSSEEKDDSIILMTKSRGLHINYYNYIKDTVFKKLNDSGKKIILMGERKIDYESQLPGKTSIYFDWDREIIFSIYDDCIKNLNNVTDLTIEKVMTPNIENLKKDFDIVKRNKVLGFGVSGILTLSIVFTDVLSCVTPDSFNTFVDPQQKNYKHIENFLSSLDSFLNS